MRRALGGLVPVMAVVLLVLFVRWAGPGSDALVVYCAHDAEHAEAVLRDYERLTGQRLAIQFDTEATKSLGLVERLLHERAAPRCDVFWNNELLGTVALAREGVLEPYQGPGWQRIPAQHRDPEGRWTGFGARMRVWIARSAVIPPGDRAALERRLAGPDYSKLAMAKPLFGTTLTQYAAFAHLRGMDALASWHADWRARGGLVVPGNAVVKQMVAEGACDLGLTDTDDAFGAIAAGKPVWMAPVELDGRTIAIPNTVAIVRGSARRDAARRLVDYLCSAEVEVRLAQGAARQIPLGEVDAAAIPPEVQALREPARRGVPLAELEPWRARCLEWLRSPASGESTGR